MEEINSNTIYGFLRRTKQNLTSQSAFISTRTRRLLCRACLPWEGYQYMVEFNYISYGSKFKKKCVISVCVLGIFFLENLKSK